MSIDKLFENITREGFTARKVDLFTGTENNRPGIMVSHNYEGTWPTPETWRAFYRIQKLARAAGFQSEERGYFTATLIW